MLSWRRLEEVDLPLLRSWLGQPHPGCAGSRRANWNPDNPIDDRLHYAYRIDRPTAASS